MKLIRFLKYNRHKVMTIKAYIYSAIYRLLILTVKPKYLRKYWGAEGKESPEEETREAYQYAMKVAYSVDKVCTKTKWESKCLVRALTAQRLLIKKGYHSTLYLGCGKDGEKMVAHAWLRCGNFYVTGGNGKEYAIVSKFYK